MKNNRRLKTRLCSTMLAVCLLFSLLPMSVITLATEGTPVTVTWEPRKQSSDGVGEVLLSACLTADEEGPAGAMIEITLEAPEAAALDWKGASIGESELGEEQQTEDSNVNQDDGDQDNVNQDDVNQGNVNQDNVNQDNVNQDNVNQDNVNQDNVNQDDTDRNDDQQSNSVQSGIDKDEGTDEDSDTEEEKNAGPIEQVLTFHDAGTAGSQAVLIKKDDDSAVLRILLTGTSTYEEVLTFSAKSGNVIVDVGNGDICVQTYDADSLPDMMSAGLLKGGSSGAIIQVPTEPFKILQTLPREVTIVPGSDEVVLGDEESGGVTYIVTLQDLSGSGEAKTYTFTLTLPEGLALPAGDLKIEENAITCGGTEIAVLSHLPDDVTVSGARTTASGLTFTITLPAGGNEGDAGSGTGGDSGENFPSCQFNMTVKENSFIRSSEAISGKMTLTATDSTGESLAAASVQITAGEAILPGAGEGLDVEALNRSGQLTQTVAWADNNNEEDIRPDWSWKEGDLAPRLFFTINGVRTELTEETLANVGLTQKTWPTIASTAAGSFTVSNLPTKIQEADGFGNETTYDVTWSMEPPSAVPDGYAFVEVTEDNMSQYPSAKDQPGWYYMLQGDFTFTLEVKQGAPKDLDETQIRAILDNFEFQWTYGSTTEEEALADLISQGHASVDVDGKKVTISGLWKYNLDGSPIVFHITEIPDSENTAGDGKLTEDELSGSGLLEAGSGDWLQVLYDNSGVPNYADHTTAVYSRGKLQLILSGETTFSAEKRWLDETPNEGVDSRPDVTFTLWRYREGQTYNTAQQIIGANLKLESGGDKDPVPSEDGYCYYPISFSGVTLDKYDPEGYAYIYGVKEEMQYAPGDNSYETLFGVVSSDDKIVEGSDVLPENYSGGTKRVSGDTLLYKDGTLSNRLKDSMEVSVTKTWEAAAYQSEFDHVAVELTLQSRVKGSAEWTNADTYYLYNFTAERLSETCTVYMPEYDALGREMEYQWIETAVYQGVTASTDKGVEEQIADPGSGVEKIEIENNSFQMTQGTETVTYISEVDEDGNITNRIDANIDYHVIKEWSNGTEPHGVTINIYQVSSGSSNFDLSKAYASFQYGVTGMLVANSATGAGIERDGVTVTQDTLDSEAKPWYATVNNLPRFDENGRPYEYILLEAGGFPSYTTKRDPAGDYVTTVLNGGPGEAIPILVRKVWLDDGDDLHRDPVTFSVYSRSNNAELETVTLGGADNPGVWHEVVQVAVDEDSGIEDVDDLYVVETSVGSHSSTV